MGDKKIDRDSRWVLLVSALSDDDLEELGKSKVSEEYQHLDDELEE